MRIAFFVFARVDSSRLPAKAFLRLGGSTVLGTILSKIKKIEGGVPIVLTSDRSIDDCIESYANSLGVESYRGSLSDVSMRIVGAIERFGVDAFFRVNGDSPCIDESLITTALEQFRTGKYDFVSNLVNRTFPYGVAVELFDARAYIAAQQNFITLDQREHATSYFYTNLTKYRYGEIKSERNFTKYGFTIDTLDDYLKFLAILEGIPDFLELDVETKIKRLEEATYD